MDVTELLADFGFADRSHDGDTVTFTVDAAGTGTLASDRPGQPAMEILGFTTPELATFVQRLDAGDLNHDERNDSGRYASVEEWLELPEPLRTTMAALYHADVPPTAGREARATDLTFDQLRRAARTVTELPEPTGDVVRRLLASTDTPLEELIVAAQATTS